MKSTLLTDTIYELLELAGWSQVGVVAILAGSVLAALVVHGAVFMLLRRLAGPPDGQAQRIVRRTRGPTRLAVAMLALALALPAADINPELSIFVQQMLQIGMVALLGWSAVIVINTAWEFALRRHDVAAADNLQARKFRTQMGILRRAALLVVTLFTVGAILMAFPSVRQYGISLFASAGVAGIVLGFAARPILSNLIAGVQIALTQPIRLDDVVIVEGEWGRVEEITTTYVVVRIWDWRWLVVPLSYFIEKPFENWTRESASIIGAVVWHLDYTAPIDQMRVKLNEWLRQSKLWDGGVANLQVVDASERTLKVRGLMSARDSSAAWDLRCEMREKMVAWLQREHPRALPRIRAEPADGALRAADA